LCGIGEGSCSDNKQCLSGLVCKPGGYKYGLPESASACQPFHCLNRKLDDNLGDASKNETGIDCGGECGSCYIDPVNGNPLHCRVWNRCTSGHGRCQYDDECAPGLVCGATTQGPKWGLPAGVGVCVVPHCDNNKLDVDETHKDCGGADCGFVCP
jgi:hypothetical protein